MITLVEIVLPQILIRGVTSEQVIADRQNRMADRHDDAFAASPRRNPMILDRQVLMLGPCGPMCGFRQLVIFLLPTCE